MTEIMEWQIVIVDFMVEGHPLARFVKNEQSARILFNMLKKQYASYEIRLLKIERSLVEIYEPPPPPRKEIVCPRGHSGIIDGKPVVVNAREQGFLCTICGDFFRPTEKAK